MGKTTIQSTVMSGSNSNGNWIKFANGIMICYGEVSIASNNWGGTFTFPQTFISNPFVIESITVTGNNVCGINSKTILTTNVAYSTTTNSYNRVIYAIAIGRWK